MKSLNFCMVVVFMCASTGCGETPVKSGEITIADSGVGDTADTGTNETSGTSDNHPVDSDSDGYAPFNANGQVVDCNDSNADIHPGANEICDGVDNDCDGQVDEGYNTVVLYADQDGDGYGNPSQSVEMCPDSDGYVSDNTDCDDSDANIHPGAEDVVGDGVDSDCSENGAEEVEVDNDMIIVTSEATVDQCADGGIVFTFGLDEDSDGQPDPATAQSVIVCNGQNGTNGNNGQNGQNGQNGSSVVMVSAPADVANCPNGGYVLTFGVDADNDGQPDPATAQSFTLCNGEDGQDGQDAPIVDQDGDGVELGVDCDDNDANISGPSSWYQDVDADLFGAGDVIEACISPGNDFVNQNNDCNDADAAINPGAVEIEDGLDNNCDGSVDEGTDAFDDDGDSFSENDGDCDDTDALISPDAADICGDGIDQDCNGQVDDGPQGTFYADTDADGFGDLNQPQNACVAPVGFVETSSDCDDTDAAINPGAVEIEDGLDNNCDGSVDEGTDAFDDDGDSFSENDGDCDDTDALISPDEIELCDGLDNNCDGQVDEGVLMSFYADTDADGFGDLNQSQNACVAPVGFVETSSDCDDTDAAISPDAIEICDDGIDNNCDGDTDGDDASCVAGSIDISYPGALTRTLNVQVYYAYQQLGVGWDLTTTSNTDSLNINLSADEWDLTDVCGFRFNVSEGSPAFAWLCQGFGGGAQISANAQIDITVGNQSYDENDVITWSAQGGGCSALLQLSNVGVCEIP